MDNMKFNTQMSTITPVNSNLAKCKIRVMYCGKNRNSTSFDKQMVMDKMIPTIYNTPIIGYMEDNNFTDHGDRLTINDDGDVEFKTITYAIGMIPESTEITWEKHLENDGLTEHEYLCCTGYVWKRFENECEKILNDSSRHSMEITIKDMEWDEKQKAFNIKDAEFAGFCAIGVEPCFEGSKIGGVNSYSKLTLDFNLLKDEINKYLNNEEGGGYVPEVKEELETTETDTTDVEVVDTQETDETIEVVEVVEETIETDTQESNESDEGETDTETDEAETTDVETETEVVVEEPSVDFELLYNELKVVYETLEQEVNSLREFKLGIEKQEKLDKVNGFASHLSDEELEQVYACVDSKTMDELETMCFALLGKKKASENVSDKVNDKFSKQENTNRNVKVATVSNTYGMSGSWLDILSETK